MNCLNCSKEVKQTEGKRQKLYCDNNGKCKNEYFRKNREIRKVVLVEDENGLWKTSDGRKCNLIWQDDKIISPDSELPKEVKKENKATETTNEPIENKKVYTLTDMPKDLGFFQKRQWLLNHGLKEK